jgi:predicted DNA-binding protein
VAEKKMGRPTDSVKDTTIRARMNEETVKRLDKCCEVMKATRSEVLRTGIDKVYEELPKKR